MRPGPAGGVVAGEERDDGEALHGQREVLAHHLGQLVGLALEGEGRALDLLVVLELHLEEPDHLDRHAGRPGDGDRREAVGREDLLHGVVGDDVARRGAPVAGHHHAVGVAQRHHGGAVGRADRRRPPRADARGGVGSARGQAQQADEVRARITLRGKEGKRHRVLLPALLHVVAHELLGVVLEDLVDLVEEVVELRLDLLAPLGGRRRGLVSTSVSVSVDRVPEPFFFCSCSAIVPVPVLLFDVFA